MSTTPTEQLAAEEGALRNQVLEEIQQQVPALIQVFLFDLMTGSVLARRGRGTASVKVGLMAERIPAMTLYLRDLVATEDGDQIDVVEITTERMLVLVAIVDETQEAIALFADKSQPTALLSAALTRSVRAYVGRVH